MKNFVLTNLRGFRGYINKHDITNAGDNFLVNGSQNVVSTEDGKIAIRRGYELDGADNNALTPIESSFVWQTHRGLEIPLRAYDDELEYRYDSGDGNGPQWRKLADGWSSVAFNFTTFWDGTTEFQDFLLFVNGDSNIYDWSGGITTVDITGSTATTLKKQGGGTWAEEGFLTSGTRRVIIGTTAYTYTGGETTDTLTGVTPDPTAGGHSDGDVAVQQIRTTANTPASGYDNDLILTLENQVWIASFDSRDVYKSAVGDFTDYTFSSPRQTGEGALLTLDSTPTGLVVQEQNMYISGAKDEWYRVIFELSNDLQNEDLRVTRLKTSALQSAVVQSAIFKIKNDIVFLSNEPTIDSLGRIEDVDTPQSLDLSDPIKLYLRDLDTTNAAGIFWRNNFYMAFPNESIVLIFNIERGHWESPQILPVSRFAIIDGELYGHSNAVPETYKLFTGTNDNGNPIDARATFSYRNYGRRDHKNNFTEWLSEGYLSENTVLDYTIRYDYLGFTSVQSYEIRGDGSQNNNIIFKNTDDGSLGKKSLGKASLGGKEGEAVLPSDLNKFRAIQTMVKEDFYEVQIEYSSNEVDYDWQLLAFGGNIQLSTADNNELKL